MQIINGGRRFGKTTRLIEMSAQSGSRIVTFNLIGAQNVQRRADEMGKKIPQVFSIGDILSGRMKGLPRGKILIDELELCLQAIFQEPIEAATLGAEIIQMAMPEELRLALEGQK